MSQETTNTGGRLARIITQRLESLRDAGISHLPKTGRTAAASQKVTAPPSEPIPLPTPAPASAVSPPSAPLAADAGDDRVAALAAIAQKVAACTRCAELARTRTQTVFGVGNPHARLVFLGEAPGEDEDRRGEPFVGRAGQLLTDIIVKGMKLRREDVYIMNILRCRPPGNRTPLPLEAAACREYLDAQLDIIRPEFICCLGACAAQNLLQTEATIGRLRGSIREYRGIKVLCTYHPAYLLRNPAAKRQVWDDIQILMAEMGLDVKKE
jgi:uracil-DNA glycosylase